MNQMSGIQTPSGTQPYRMSAEDYIRLIWAGGFGDAHVELVEGELVVMSPSHSKHGKFLGSVFASLSAIYSSRGFDMYIDTIVQLTGNTVRAPDTCVTDIEVGGSQNLLPAEILLAVEISQSTLLEDLGRKRIDYASSGIRNYWVIDVEGRRIHCYTDPLGADYSAIRVIGFGEPVPGAGAGADGAIVVG